MILIRAVGSMHPSVLLELNKFVIGSLNTILQRLPLGSIPYYVNAAKHRQGQGLTPEPEANWHRLASAHLRAQSATHSPQPWVSSSSTKSQDTTQLFYISQFKVHKEERRLLCSPPERDFQSMKQSMCCISASMA